MRRWVSLLFLYSVNTWSLTETTAIERGLAHPQVQALLAAEQSLAAGNEAAAGRWSNPEIEYSRETLDLPGGPAEERSLWIRQRLSLAGVPGLRRRAARAERVASEARLELTKRETIAELQILFYEAFAADAKADLLRQWHERLQQLLRATAQRVAAGDASAFDHLRLEREGALLQTEWLQAQAQAAIRRDRLFSQIGAAPEPLQAQLFPPAGATTIAVEAVDDHPLLRALRAQADSAGVLAKAARREAWPEITVGVGRRELAEPGLDADGNLLSLAVEVPLFDRHTGEAQAAAAQSRILNAEYALAKARLLTEMRAAQRTLDYHRAAPLLSTPDSSQRSLAAIAENTYAAGEIGILELIDAHRAELAVREAAITHALNARKAFIELQLLTGNSQ